MKKVFLLDTFSFIYELCMDSTFCCYFIFFISNFILYFATFTNISCHSGTYYQMNR